jgi:hypothetical protein
MNSKPTKYAFLIGVAYFCCMAVAHFFSIKVPVLFVYYNTPFHAYQDKIISFAVCAYVAQDSHHCHTGCKQQPSGSI